MHYDRTPSSNLSEMLRDLSYDIDASLAKFSMLIQLDDNWRTRLMKRRKQRRALVFDHKELLGVHYNKTEETNIYFQALIDLCTSNLWKDVLSGNPNTNFYTSRRYRFYLIKILRYIDLNGFEVRQYPILVDLIETIPFKKNECPLI